MNQVEFNRKLSNVAIALWAIDTPDPVEIEGLSELSSDAYLGKLLQLTMQAEHASNTLSWVAGKLERLYLEARHDGPY